ncbi:MAG: PAS domain S-box protein [Rhodocyclales bacterium]|nr:PAS domain S-box protein [Rhodocyclales bacterium]
MAQALTLAVAALGIATASQYVFGWQLGIDELLFRDTANAYNAFRGRMSPYTSIGFVLIGTGLAAWPRPALRPLIAPAAVAVMTIGAVTLLGYLWNASELVTDRWLPPVAIHTAFAFLLLGAGMKRANRMREWLHAAQRPMIRGPIETRILAGFISALVLLFIASGYSYRTSVEFEESARQVAHTHEVRAELNRLDARILAAESMQLNYLLTGALIDKGKYVHQVAQVDRYLQSLSRLVVDNPEQMQNLATLRPFVVERMSSLARQVSVFESRGRRAVLALRAVDDGVVAMEAIDVLVDQMDEVETKLLSKRVTDRTRARELALVALLLMLAVATALLTALFRGIRREFAARAQAEDQFNQFFSLSLDMLCIANADGYFKRISPAFSQTLGWSTEEILAKPFLDFIHPDDQAVTLREVERQVRAGESVLQFENRYLHKDGSWRLLSWKSVPHESGLMFATARDVTKRKAVEDQVRDGAARLQAILDTVVDGVITIDGRGTVQTLNPAAEHVFGYAVAEVLGRNVKMLMPEPYHSQHDEYLEHFRVTGEARIIGIGREVIGKRKDGSTFPLELAVSEMMLGGERHYTGIVRDITERKAVEQAVVAAKNEAEQANAAKDSFLATMSHELRTPLNGLLGMLELLGLSRLDREQLRTLEIARDSGRGLVRIIDDVLDHAKIEAGKLQIRLEPVSIEDLLQAALNTYHAVASAKGLSLKQAIDPRISPTLLADPLRVSQILNNLVSNALKFTTEGYVEVRAEWLGCANGTETVRLAVKDTGIGIDPDMQGRLFRPFEQAGTITARLYGGTGLGLSICRRLAQMMGGVIQVESEPGKGTTMSVTLTLPVSDAVPAKAGHGIASMAAPIRTPASPGAGPLVLAVDDHPTNRELLARQIVALGLRVQTAVDGREGLAWWQAGGIALVVTDCNMPEMDGYAFSRAIREIEAKEGRPRTPIIAWTANVLPGATAQCHAAGMDDVLRKPSELAVLKQMLVKWLPHAAMATDRSGEVATAESSTAQNAPIGLAELDKIAATASERAEILLDFMSQTRSDFAALRAALSQGDLPACTRIAHRMKGSSRMVGALYLAAANEAMEHAARQGSLDDAAAAQAAMLMAMERLEAYLIESTRTKEKRE